MKNLFFGFIATMIFGFMAFGQEYVNKNAEELLRESKKPTKVIKVGCVTWSCCSLGPFEMNIWEQKECHYIYTNRVISVMDVKDLQQNDYNKDEITIKNDITLIDLDNYFEEKGEELIMKAGLYKVINGQIAFEPSVSRIRIKKSCWVEKIEGHFFGHQYSSTTVHMCVYYPVWESSQARLNGGYAEIDINNDRFLLDLSQQNNNILSIDEDIIINNKYILKAGKYSVLNGKFYTRDLTLK